MCLQWKECKVENPKSQPKGSAFMRGSANMCVCIHVYVDVFGGFYWITHVYSNPKHKFKFYLEVMSIKNMYS